MTRKGNKRKNAGQTGTTQPKRQKTKQENEPSEAIESSGEQPSPFSQVTGESLELPKLPPDSQGLKKVMCA